MIEFHVSLCKNLLRTYNTKIKKKIFVIKSFVLNKWFFLLFQIFFLSIYVNFLQDRKIHKSKTKLKKQLWKIPLWSPIYISVDIETTS